MKTNELIKELQKIIDKPLTLIDVETTGVNIDSDNIIQFGALLIPKSGPSTTTNFRFKPLKPIPAEASAIHGIYDKDVSSSPGFSTHAFEIAKILSTDGYVCGYNLIDFDLKIIKNELQRAGVELKINSNNVLDCYFIFKKHNPHNLSNTLLHYTNETPDNAHDAIGDIISTAKVALAQIKLEGRPIEELCKENQAKYDHIVEKDGVEYLNFGKFKGKPLKDADKGFLNWILNKDFPDEVKAKVKKYL